MKQINSKFFISIWGIHIFIYYAVYLSSIAVIYGNYSQLYKVIFGFTIGLYGGLEQIPLFFMIPLVLMLILIKTKLNNNWFTAYVLSISLAYLINYLWMFSNNKHDKILFSPDSMNLIYFIIPSLIISIACNWLIFRNKYKKLGV